MFVYLIILITDIYLFCFIGPAATNDETKALDQVKQTLRNMFNNISFRASSTDTG